MKFTKNSVAALALPAGKSELLVFDDTLSGFGIRLRAGGSRTWIVQYQIGRKQRRVSIGPVSGLAVEKAREKAGIILARVRLGEDPQADKFKVRRRQPKRWAPWQSGSWSGRKLDCVPAPWLSKSDI